MVSTLFNFQPSIPTYVLLCCLNSLFYNIEYLNLLLKFLNFYQVKISMKIQFQILFSPIKIKTGLLV